MNFPEPLAYGNAAQELNKVMSACELCPRKCGVNRLWDNGFCGSGVNAQVNLYQLHFGEEPPISGVNGSGTVFFSGCTLSCAFCQNHQISTSHERSQQVGAWEMAEIFMALQEKGAHNINLVSPTPHLVVILKALLLAREGGLTLPVVYNTSGYEKLSTLQALAGLVDIYLPDYKYYDAAKAKSLSGAEDYPRAARMALEEMLAQVGHLELDEKGVAVRGLLVRHLVLPNNLSDTPKVLNSIADICGTDTWVSLMSQYTPLHQAAMVPGLERAITQEEYDAACRAFDDAGLHNGFVQELSSTGSDFIPSFKSEHNL